MDALVSLPDNRVIRENAPAVTTSLEGFLAIFETYLVDRANYFDHAVRDLAVQALTSGGKRIRPALVHACGAGNLAVSENLIKAAAIVEFVHVATLVHDDVLDDASIRRDRQTVYADRGATAAILLGDALFAHALEMASEFPENEVCRWVAAATRRTCSGEIQQSFLRGDFTLTSLRYRQIIEAKTAELFSVSCRLGSHVAGLDDATSALACDFGRRLGLAYQIYDDLADVFGREEDFGKSLGRDLAHGKVTLPTITLFSKLSKVEASKLHETLFNSGREPNPEIVLEMVDLMRKHGVDEECRELLDEELSAIGNTLSEFADDTIARHLDDLRQVIVDRIAILLG
jgi:octaprenyl-diphosphate synthase